MKCTKCKNEIPAKRVELGYKDCVDCSTTEAYSCVDIVYHKTGNTIQVMDKETADAINKLSRRSGFGVMRGMLGGSGKSEKYDTVKISKVEPVIVYTKENFDKVGAETMDILEIDGYEVAYRYIYKSHERGFINTLQKNKLVDIIKEISGYNKPKAPEKIDYNRLSRNGYKEPKPEVSEDVSWVFKNWKR